MPSKETIAAVAVVFLALSFGSGAFAAGDQLEDGEDIYVTTGESPHGDAYAEMVDGELQISVERANQEARTWIDDVFRMGYGGATSADVWVEHEGNGVSFYDSSTVDEIQSPEESVTLETGDTLDVGILVDSTTSTVSLSEVTLKAQIDRGADEDGEDVEQDEPDTGLSGVQVSGELVTDPDVEVEDETIEVGLGDVSVSVDEPDLRYTVDVSPDTIVAGESVTAVVTASNDGPVAGSADVEIRVDGDIVQTDEYTVEPESSETRSYVIGFDEPGEYVVAVGEDSTVVVVEPRGLAGQIGAVVNAFTPGTPGAPWASLVVAALVTLTSIALIARRRDED